MESRNLYRRAIFSLLILTTLGCGKCGGVGSFWKGYEREKIVNQYSDQGPWGGSRWIHWESDIENYFTPEASEAFAEKKGWDCFERTRYSAKELEDWFDWDGNPVFPLFHDVPTEQVYDHGIEGWSRHILSDSVVIKCETSWLREDPGSNETSPAYGYIQINDRGTRMAVYHFWGNG